MSIRMPSARAVGAAFDLGRPLGELVLVRRGDTDTWRLDTSSGRYLVKGYRSTTDGQFTPGGLLDQLRVAMAFEDRALRNGVEMPEPVMPREPVQGWLARIDDRYVRVHHWLEGRSLGQDEDIAGWLGRTMAHVHRLQPSVRPGLPDWWRASIRPRTAWEEWIVDARHQDRPWANLVRERLPTILDLTSRLQHLCLVAPDPVTTHGDVKPHNLLVTASGPVLVDWDSVRTDSAALEAGRVAHIFGGGDPSRIEAILRAYAEAGGETGWAGRDLFLSVARHDLHGLFARILISLGRTATARWMGDGGAIERDIQATLSELPARIDRLDRLASGFAGAGSS